MDEIWRIVVKTIGLFANPQNTRAPDVVARIEKSAAALGMSILADTQTAAMSASAPTLPIAEMPGKVDVLLALGGDGTMLRAVRELNGQDLPVMGLNIGSLGFMTSVAEDSLERAMACLAADQYMTSPRSMIECEVVSSDGDAKTHVGLNDVVMQGVMSSRVVTLNMTIDDEQVASYVCDGLIVATPTGSTGHSLSAGGPIIMPGTRALVVSVICPHSLSARPLVISDDHQLAFTCPDMPKRGVQISIDGQVEQTMGEGDRVFVKRCAQDIRFIHLPDYSYFPVLRQKLGWRGSHV
ncbi:MAG: NAD+ kinase [Candidatus Promineifilaceae bacterium]